MAKFGAKTVARFVEEIKNTPDMTCLDCTNNASIKMKGADGLKQIAEVLKPHKNITKVLLGECEVTDDGAAVIADILANNNVIEELVLEKNKVASQGAIAIADALAKNTGLQTLSLLQQTVASFGPDALDHFIKMYDDNITLTKIFWRLTDKKANMLNKLSTRNVEIKKRKDKGEDYTSFLPDHMKGGAGGYKADDTPKAPEPEPTPAKVEEDASDLSLYLKAYQGTQRHQSLVEVTAVRMPAPTLEECVPKWWEGEDEREEKKVSSSEMAPTSLKDKWLKMFRETRSAALKPDQTDEEVTENERKLESLFSRIDGDSEIKVLTYTRHFTYEASEGNDENIHADINGYLLTCHSNSTYEEP